MNKHRTHIGTPERVLCGARGIRSAILDGIPAREFFERPEEDRCLSCWSKHKVQQTINRDRKAAKGE